MMINFVLSVFIHTKLRAGGGINFPITEKSCHQRARRRRRDGEREEAKSLLKFASRKLVTVNSVGGTTIQLKQIESTNHFHCFVGNPKQREKHFLPSICATLFPRWEEIVQFTWGGSSYIKLQRWTLSENIRLDWIILKENNISLKFKSQDRGINNKYRYITCIRFIQVFRFVLIVIHDIIKLP